MEEFIGHTGITAADLKGNTADLFTAYRNHEVAMIRGTCGEANHYGVEAETQILPYFGDSPEDSWYLTYPAFQAAISARAAENPARRELLLDILEAMLDQEGLRHIATGQDMIAYTKGVQLPLSSLLDNIPPYLDSNHLYIRLASSEMFSISQQVVQGMISGEYPNARAAFDAFNRAMQAEEEALPAAARLDAGYTYAFRPDGGSQAASAVMNTVREASRQCGRQHCRRRLHLGRAAIFNHGRVPRHPTVRYDRGAAVPVCGLRSHHSGQAGVCHQ